MANYSIIYTWRYVCQAKPLGILSRYFCQTTCVLIYKTQFRKEILLEKLLDISQIFCMKWTVLLIYHGVFEFNFDL